MLEKRKRKGFALLTLLTLGVLAAILFPKMNQAVADWMIRRETEQILRERENNRLMLTLPLMDAHELEGLTQVSDLEISALELNGYPAPVDEQTGTVYLPQAAGNLGGYDQLQGKITASSRDYQLYVLREPVLENLTQAVEQGEALTLIVREGSRYQVVSLVITTLPVIRMEGVVIGLNEKSREIYQGTFLLFDNTGAVEVVTSANAQWHRRGETSAVRPKPPWKITLKDEEGENTNRNLLGMGSDDDWILSSMIFDDTKLREKIVVDLWNDYAAAEDWNYPMSPSEYVEVVMDGRYQGLFSLRRRVDAKFLDLQQEDILLKGVNIWHKVPPEEAYDVIETPNSEQQAYDVMRDIEGNLEDAVNISNMVDVNLLLNFLVAPDNVSYKNMFYVLDRQQNEYRMYYIPWDTDMSLGTIWRDDAFVYDRAFTMQKITFHQDFLQLMDTSETYWQMLVSRWQELRTSMYSQQTIQAVLQENYSRITDSGAYARDQERWGTMYDGVDTPEELYRYMIDRIAFLDEYYQQPYQPG